MEQIVNVRTYLQVAVRTSALAETKCREGYLGCLGESLNVYAAIVCGLYIVSKMNKLFL